MSPGEITPDATPPRFDAEPFRPDGGTPLFGIILLAAGLALTAPVLGFLLSFVGQWLYLPIISPLIAAFLLGGVGWGLVRVGKVRSPAAAGTIVALSGLGMMFSMHYFDCLRAINFVQWQAVTPVIVFKYIDFVADAGVVIGEVGKNGGVNLGYIGSYSYFAVEACLAAALAGAITRKAAVAPFCRGCNQWKHLRPLAELPHVSPKVAVEALRAGALLDLMETGTPTAGGHPLRLKAYVCQRCGGDGSVVAVVQQIIMHSNGQKQVKALGQYVYPGQVLALVEQYAPKGRGS